jgi:hypothetical protein
MKLMKWLKRNEPLAHDYIKNLSNEELMKVKSDYAHTLELAREVLTTALAINSLELAFIWDRTPQGAEYWANVSIRFSEATKEQKGNN